MMTVFIIAAVVVFIIGLVAVIVERTEQRDEAYRLAAQAHQTAAQATAQAEQFADELTHADGIIRHLSADLLAAQTRLSDAIAEAEHAPAPVVPLVPRQRDGAEHDWPVIVRQIQHDDLTALMRATEE